MTIPANISAADSPIRRPDTNSCTSEPLAVADMALQARPRTMRMIPYRIFLPPQVLCAAQQVKDLLIVINPHAALRRILAVHQLGKRNGKLPADLFNNAVIGHTLAVFPFGNRLIGHAEFFPPVVPVSDFSPCVSWKCNCRWLFDSLNFPPFHGFIIDDGENRYYCFSIGGRFLITGG